MVEEAVGYKKLVASGYNNILSFQNVVVCTNHITKTDDKGERQNNHHFTANEWVREFHTRFHRIRNYAYSSKRH